MQPQFGTPPVQRYFSVRNNPKKSFSFCPSSEARYDDIRRTPGEAEMAFTGILQTVPLFKNPTK